MSPVHPTLTGAVSRGAAAGPAAPPAATARTALARRLDDFFARPEEAPGTADRGVPLATGDRLLVAFSGGPDSAALLAALAHWAPGRGVELAAAHLDHGLDPGSAERARAAFRLAAALGVPCGVRRIEVARRARPGESPEAAARRVRYAFLEGERRRLGARWTVTAHHRDDQAETVLLRLLDGSGAAGLAGIRPSAAPADGFGPSRPAALDPKRPAEPRIEPAGAAARAGRSARRRGAPGRVVRPLLDVPREELRRSLTESGLTPVEDPTNRDLSVPRNRVRHVLLPALAGSHGPASARTRGDRLAARASGSTAGGTREAAVRFAGSSGGAAGDLAERLAALAAAAAGAAGTVDRHLLRRLSPRSRPGGALAIGRADLAALPPPLLPAALALLHRLAGAPYPPGSAARAELLRQLVRASAAAEDGSTGGAIGCDCGGGWRWSADGPRMVLARSSRPREAPAPFTYTLEVPGELEIPELAVRFRLVRGRFEGWMLRGERCRAGLALPLGPGEIVTVRSRRPGDRLHPLGAPGERRLKEVLIDRRVPRAERGRLPLLCLGGDGRRVAWVPGVTIDERYRLATAAGAEGTVWLAAIEPLESRSRVNRCPGDGPAADRRPTGTSRPAPEERGNRR